MLRLIARRFELSLVRARSLLRAATFNFVFVASVTALKSATNALYLARRDPQDLPYLYLGTALVVTVVTFILGRRLAGLSAKPLLREGLFTASGILLLLSTLAAIDYRPALGLLYVSGEAYATALAVLFWARLGEVFDVRAGKRVFGLVAALGMAGAVVGGLLVKLLAGVVPSVTWCFVAAVVLLPLQLLIGAKRTPGSVRRERAPFLDGLKFAVLRRYPRAVAFLVLLLSVQTAAIDYVFRTGTYRFEQGNEASMAALFGILNAVVGVFAILFQFALTARLLSRFGVFVYLGVVPAACVLSALVALWLPAVFLPIFVLKVLEMMASYSLNQPGLQLLYNPIPAALRGPIRAVVDGAVRKLGGAIGGLVLLLVGAFVDSEHMISVVAVLGGVLVFSLRGLRPLYLRALEEKLAGRERRIPVLDPRERATREKLLATLKDGGEHETLAAIHVLEDEPSVDLTRHIPELLAHPAERVRQKAVQLMERRPDPAYADALVAMLDAPEDRPKAQAARALALVDPARAEAVLAPVLLDAQAERGLVAAAIAALYHSSGVGPSGPSAALAEAALLRLLEAAPQSPAAERRDLAHLIGALGPGPHASRLESFLEDSNPQIRKAAVRAAALVKDTRLTPALIRLLEDRGLRDEVRLSLAAHGDEVVPLLESALNDRRRPVELRVQIPRILRLIGTSYAAERMLESNIHDDAYLRYVIIEELARMCRVDPGLEIDQRYNDGAVLRRLRAYAHYRPMTEDLLHGPPELSLLRRAVSDRVSQNLEAVLRLLGLAHGMKTMENALAGFRHGDRSSHADAIEILDVALSGSAIRDQIIEALETSPPVGDPARALSCTEALAEGRDVLLALIAAETLRRLGRPAPEVREPTSGEPLMPKSIIDRLFQLQNVQPFRDLSIDDLAAVAAIATHGHAEPREEIYREGEPGDAMYVIISGDIHLLAKGAPLLDLHVGDSFGQTSILDGGPRPVTAKAGDLGVDYMRIDRQSFLDLMVDRPGLMTGMLSELAARIRELVDISRSAESGQRHTELASGATR